VVTGETEPKPTVEAQVLTALGYAHCLDAPVGEAGVVVGRNFLDVYGDSPHREQTEDLLHGFAAMAPTDPDYEATKAYLTRFIEPYFGAPQVGP